MVSFVSFRIFFFRTTGELDFFFFAQSANFFPEYNIRLYDKNFESDFFFFLHQNQNIFYSNIGNQNILEKKHTPPPPWKLNGSSLTYNYENKSVYCLLVLCTADIIIISSKGSFLSHDDIAGKSLSGVKQQ